MSEGQRKAPDRNERHEVRWPAIGTTHEEILASLPGARTRQPGHPRPDRTHAGRQKPVTPLEETLGRPAKDGRRRRTTETEKGKNSNDPALHR